MSPRVHTESLHEQVDAWVSGFGVSRQVPVRRLGELTEVEVGSQGRRLELVLVEPDGEVVDRTLARLVGTDDVWSTIFTSGNPRRDLPAGTRAQLSDEVFMALDLVPSAAVVSPGIGRVETESEPGRATVRILDEGVVAARGQIAVVGDTAVFDRIETHDAYRRRGLGTAVMSVLAHWAVGEGACRGLLAASLDGQALYARLGWEPVAAMLTVAGVGASD